MMSLEDKKDIVRRYQEIHNSNDLDALSEVVSEELLTPKMMSGMKPGLQGAKQVHATTLMGMPDWHTEINDLIAEGDRVVARITMTGTHTGNFWGIPATGRRVEPTPGSTTTRWTVPSGKYGADVIKT